MREDIARRKFRVGVRFGVFEQWITFVFACRGLQNRGHALTLLGITQTKTWNRTFPTSDVTLMEFDRTRPTSPPQGTQEL
jgi:hypothetical protein